MTGFERFLLGCVFFVLLLPNLAGARPLPPETVPEPLKPWIDWVLWDHQEQNCPMLYDGAQRRCVWPARLELQLSEQGGRFTQALTVYQESRVELPGSDKYWPAEVRVNGQPAGIIAQQQTPQLLLAPGSYDIEGTFLWERLPEALPIPGATGLVSLQVEGVEREHPQLKDGQLWLHEDATASAPTPQDHLSLELFRRVIDSHPLRLVSLLRLEVSGRQREVILGRPLLAGFIPVEIQSPLPARLEPDGSLRVQVRPGIWELELHALHPDYLTELTLPAQPPPWPNQEIWSFESKPALRLVEIEGVAQVDPRQTRLPDAWQSLPAYQLSAGQSLRLQVVRRGDPQPEPDALQLQRDLWLDFDGQGYTLRDRINGRMTSGWRLSANPELELGRATLDGESQFITKLAPDNRAGLEVRQGLVDLVAESRIQGPLADLPATGWDRDFQQVGALLHLPPGWRLLAATGMDAEHHSWLKQWTLYDLFLVFVIAAAVGRLWGWRWAIPALFSLALIWHEPGAPRHIWLYLQALIALLRVVPVGRFRTLIKVAHLLGLATLAAIVLPFLVEQARTGLYPQLARPGYLQPVRGDMELEMLSQSAMDEAPAPRESRNLEEFKGRIATLGSALPPMPKSAAPKRWQADPEARIQTGPGLPAWQWQRIPLDWNGPVSQQQSIQLILANPRINLVLNLSRILLLLLLTWRFLELRGWRADNRATTSIMLLFSLLLAGGPEPAQAAYPNPELLQQLEQRLIEPPTCLPQCAEIQRMRLELGETRLLARLQLDALERTAIPLPIEIQQQTPIQVLLDGEPAASLARDAQGLLWVQVDPGQHEIQLAARLPKLHQLQLPLPLPPHRVEVVTSVWAVEGLHENQVPDRQLHLTRKQTAGSEIDQPDTFTSQALPPFVRIERTLRLDLEWSVETRVVRISPIGTPIVLHVPLLPGESVISEEIQVQEATALVNMAANTDQAVWLSRLPIGAQIHLTAPQTSQWIELWRLDVGPLWHARIEGLAPVHHQDQQRWLPTWMPWPGEQVELQLSRPEGIMGTTRTIDRSRLILTPGIRATDASLEFRLRSSQGGRHEISLPAQAQLLSVRIDNQTQPIRQEGTRVSLPVHPGEQVYQLTWRQDAGMQAVWSTPEVDLGIASVNSDIQVQMGQDRWVLFTSGPQLGPAVLFWGELLVILLAAVILGRLQDYSPLGAVSWLLLGIGLSQVSIWSSLLVVAAFFAFGYRRRCDPQRLAGSFNLLQIGLVLLSLFTLTTLFWAVQQGLLGLPEMQIGGNGSSAYRLNWYQDRSERLLPLAKVYSVPLLVYRLLMLAWALWLAFSLLGWVKWAWQAFSQGGRWIEIKIKLPKRKQAQPTKQS